MPSARPRTIFRRLFAALGLGVALVGAAPAAYVVGTWDPPFGAPFPDLGWRGTIKILVPDACLALGAGSRDNPGACPGLLTVDNATVEFYDVSEVVAPGGAPTTAETLDFTGKVKVTRYHLGSSTSFRGFEAVVDGLTLSSNSVLGSTGGSGNTAAFGLSFSFDGTTTHASLGWTQRQNIDCGAPPLTACLPGNGRGSSSTTPVLSLALFNDDGTPIVDGGTRSVPEPMPLGLAALGLLALGLSRRHRRRA